MEQPQQFLIVAAVLIWTYELRCDIPLWTDECPVLLRTLKNKQSRIAANDPALIFV